MGKTLIIAEKPSVAGDIARVLGKFKKEKDFFENEQYVISWAVGHVVELLMPEDIDKKKYGPSYREVAAKYKGKADAEAILTKHVTEPSMVEIDGEEEEYGAVKTRDKAKIKNLVDWILSL